MKTTFEVERPYRECRCGNAARFLVQVMGSAYLTYRMEAQCEDCAPVDGSEPLQDLEFDVEYDISPAEKQTHWEPGCDAFVTVNTISYKGQEIKRPAQWLEKLAQEAAEKDAGCYSREDALADKADHDREDY